MNRSPLTAQSPTSLLPAQNPSFSYGVPRRLTRAEKAPVVAAHASFTPIHYQQGYAYPLIVWLHGEQSDEQEVQRALPLVSARNFVAIGPRGNQHSESASNSYSWGQSPADTVDAAERVESCIALARQQFNVHPERVFLVGRGAGGTLALRLGLEYPELVAGAVSLGGPVPRGQRPLKRINAARKLPLMLAVSPNESYPLEQVMSDLRLLHWAGFSLALRLHPAGDELTTTMLSDVNRWIMESFCPTVVAARC